MNTDVRTKLHSIVDNMSHKLKLDLDNALLKLITISDEYDETNRIILTLPCVRKLVEKNADAVPHSTPPLNISAALMSLMDYQEDVDVDVEEEEEVEEPNIVISEPTFNEPIIADVEEVVEESEEELSKSRVEIVITELEQLLEEQEELVDEEEVVVDFETDEELIDEEEEVVDEEVVDEEVVDEEVVDDVVVDEEVVDDVVVDEEEEAVDDEEEEEVVDDEEEVVDEVVEEEEEGESVFEVEIDGTMYYTTNTMNGDIYEADENGDPGDKVGEFVSGQPLFSNM